MPDSAMIRNDGCEPQRRGVRSASAGWTMSFCGSAISIARFRFIRKVLGLQVERELQQPRLVQLRAGASLIDLVPASVSPHEAPDKAGRNMDHFCVRVLGFDATALKAHLAKNGVDPGDVHERYGAEGYGPSIYITDPDGNTVELKGEATRGL